MPHDAAEGSTCVTALRVDVEGSEQCFTAAVAFKNVRGGTPLRRQDIPAVAARARVGEYLRE